MKNSLTFSMFLTIFSLSSLSESLVPGPPEIVKQPPTGEVFLQLDKPFFIECEALGEPAPKYRWIKNGKKFKWQNHDDRMSQQPGRGTLLISEPQRDDVGEYQCFAENEYGIATSHSVFVRKVELKSFKKTPDTSVFGNEGEPFRLSCQSPSGQPKPDLFWIYQYSNGAFKTINSSRLTVDPEGNLWFSNLTRLDVTLDSKYSCAAISPLIHDYKIGNSVLLNVVPTGIPASMNREPPVLQYCSKKNTTALRGKQLKLYCIYGGTPLPQIVWSKGSRVIQSSDRIRFENFGKTLLITTVGLEDEDVYTCEVSNGIGKTQSHSIDLKVDAIPYFTVEPKSVNASENETIDFHCEASGVPEPEINWIHNGKPIAEAPPNPRRRVQNNRIIIDRLTKNDTGNYGCNASNSLGYVYKDVYVNVLSLLPEIIRAPKQTQAVIDQNVTMICEVTGFPKPSVKWVLNNIQLTGGRYTVETKGDLHISGLQSHDAGNYTCFAENRFGTASAATLLVVKRPTYIAEGPHDYEVAADTSVTFRCTPIADNSLELEVVWLKEDALIDFNEEPRFIPLSDYSLTITQTTILDSGTYTCLARTAIDEASAKAQLIVQDVPNPPEMTPVDCHAKYATIKWLPMGDNRAPIQHYVVEYNTTFTPELWTAADNNIPATTMSYNISMSPWTNYTFRVYAVNKIGNSLPSHHSYVCMTDSDVPYKNPEDVAGEGDRLDNLVIIWTPMLQIDHNGPKFEYRVFWKRDLEGEVYSVEHITDWKTSQLVVNNQPTFQQYRIKVMAINECGEANVAPKEIIAYSGENTPEEKPSNVTLVAIQNSTSAIISWNPVDVRSVHGHLKGYKIRTWSDLSAIHNEISVGGFVNKALINNLEPFTKNYLQVLVYNGKYYGPPSETLSFMMPEGVRGPQPTSR